MRCAKTPPRWLPEEAGSLTNAHPPLGAGCCILTSCGLVPCQMRRELEIWKEKQVDPTGQLKETMPTPRSKAFGWDPELQTRMPCVWYGLTGCAHHVAPRRAHKVLHSYSADRCMEKEKCLCPSCPIIGQGLTSNAHMEAPGIRNPCMCFTAGRSCTLIQGHGLSPHCSMQPRAWNNKTHSKALKHYWPKAHVIEQSPLLVLQQVFRRGHEQLAGIIPEFWSTVQNVHSMMCCAAGACTHMHVPGGDSARVWMWMWAVAAHFVGVLL